MPLRLKCPHCKGNKVWRKGFVPTVKGKKARFLCSDCGRSFYAPYTATKTAPKGVR